MLVQNTNKIDSQWHTIVVIIVDTHNTLEPLYIGESAVIVHEHVNTLCSNDCIVCSVDQPNYMILPAICFLCSVR